MNFRRRAFWALDLVKKGGLRKGVKKLRGAFDEKAGIFQSLELEKPLVSLVEYASKNVNYYKRAKPRLEDFKSITKLEIRNNLKDFMSPVFHKDELIEQVTSGSTGVPFTTYWSRNKKKHNTIDTIFFNQIAGYEVGVKFYYFKIWNELNQKSFLRRKIENVVPIDVRDSSQAFWLSLIQDLKKEGKVFILGYASALEELSKTCEREGVRLHPNILGIITMSEALSDLSRNHMIKWLSDNVYSRYSNMENGIIAQQVNKSGAFLINRHSFKIEVLKIDSDDSVENGDLGRIVITDLYNYAMPLIRYDTGDLGSVSSCGNYLNHIEGRKMDAIFNTSGDLVSSFIITNMMWKYTELIQYQFIQDSKTSYLFKLNIGKNVFKRELELISEFKGYLGKDAEIRIECVTEVPLLSSGKRKKVMRTYIPRS